MNKTIKTEFDNVIEKAIATYGKESQVNIAIEEMAELTKELCKDKRGFENRDSIIEEIADVHIMLRQLRSIFKISDVEIERVVNKKIKRLEERLEIEDLK